MRTDTTEKSAAKRLPILPLRDVVVYPHMVIPLFVGREKSDRGARSGHGGRQARSCSSRRSSRISTTRAPKTSTEIGTVATILQLLKLPDGTVKVLVEGVDRARMRQARRPASTSRPRSTALPDVRATTTSARWTCSRARVISQFEQYVKLNKKMPPEMLTRCAGIEHAGPPGRHRRRAHVAEAVREAEGARDRRRAASASSTCSGCIDGEIDVLQIEKRIRGRVKPQMEKSQREYYLNEQMKAIQKELGEMDDAPNELDELEQKIKAAGMPKEAKEKANAELNKLKLMSPMSAEATVVRNYIDWLVKVPWKKRTKVRKRPGRAEQVLDEDHYGLEKVKERILEYLAVQQRVKKMQGPDPVPRRSAGRRQDLARPVHRARHQPQVRAHVARRRARRGGDPRPPAHVHRLDARQDRAEPGKAGVQQPAVPARRDRQDVDGLPRRSVVGAARGARPRAELTRSTITTSRSISTCPR